MKSSTSIKSTLLSGLMLIVFFFLAQAGIVWYATSTAKTTVVENTRKNSVAASELGALAILAQQIRRYEKEYFIYVGSKEKRDKYQGEWQETMNGINKLLTKMQSGSDGAFAGGNISKIAGWSEASAFYAAEMKKIFVAVAEREVAVAQAAATAAAAANPVPAGKPGKASAGKTGKTSAGKSNAVVPISVPVPVPVAVPAGFLPVEVNTMITDGKNRFSADLIKGVAEMEKAKSAETLALADVAEQMFNKLLAAVLGTVAIGVVIALLLALRLPKAVTKPIDTLSAAAQEMSMGNLEKPYDSGGVLEFVKLAEALDRLRLGQQVLVERLKKR